VFCIADGGGGKKAAVVEEAEKWNGMCVRSFSFFFPLYFFFLNRFNQRE